MRAGIETSKVSYLRFRGSDTCRLDLDHIRRIASCLRHWWYDWNDLELGSDFDYWRCSDSQSRSAVQVVRPTLKLVCLCDERPYDQRYISNLCL